MSILQSATTWNPAEGLKKIVWQRQFDHPVGYVLLGLMGLCLGAFLAYLPMKIGVLLMGALFGLVIVFGAIGNLFFGMQIMLIASFFIGFINKYTDAPVGTALDGLLLVMTFGMLVRIVRTRDFSYFKNGIAFWVIVWIYYNIFEVLNPIAVSKLAWVFTVRSVAVLLFFFFIASQALDSVEKIKTTVKVIMSLVFLTALYSLKQEFFGFSDTEMNWLHADPERFILIFQWNRLRVFSFLSDPTTFGILMGYMAIAVAVLTVGPYKTWMKWVGGLACLSMLMGMAYAGSRTPFVMVPAGVFFYTLLNFNKKTLIAIGVVMLLGTGFILKSTSSAVVYRIQSAFKPSEDASMKVRIDNQKKIQPYIQTHPIGAGLGTTGIWGKRFTPGSWLSSFAHDSLYVRLAVETGYIGLFFYMCLIFTGLRKAIYYYFRVADPTIKNLYLYFACIIFLLALASYPQEAITILPSSIIFYTVLAMIVRLKDFDPNFAKATHHS